MADKTPDDGLTAAQLKSRSLKRWGKLKLERGTYDSHYQLLSRYVLPRSSRFMSTDRNQKGGTQHNNIIDSTATRALRTLAAGMMSGMTSPARPWFVVKTPDDDLNENYNVKTWLSKVTDLMLRIFAKSNTYNAFYSIYQELGLFGTAANFISPDFDNIIHNYTGTVGEYALALNNRSEVDTIYREFDISVNQAVQWFGRDALSARWVNAYDQGNGDQSFTVLHAVEPRLTRDASARDARNMPWRSLYVEKGGDESSILQESGFRRFPALCPRWDTTSNDTYGNSPGMEALGDVMQLQQEQYRKAEAIDYQARPPLQVPTALKDSDADFLPGGVSYYDGLQPNAGIRTAFEVNLNLQELLMDIQDVRQRINSAFYADIFLMLQQMNDPKMTATEVAERHEEKLLMLGPVLERLHNEMLTPLIEATFERIVETGVVPSPPQEVQGQQLQIEFVSILAQAQRAIGVNAVDRYVANLGSIAAIKPNILDRFDEDAWVDYYSDTLGIDPSLIVPGEKAAFIRQQRAEQQQQAERLAAAQSAASTAKDGAAAAATAQQAGIPADALAQGYGIGNASDPRAGPGPGLPTALQPGAGV
jgi:hypothetical protein